jgi:hypothetical protein
MRTPNIRAGLPAAVKAAVTLGLAGAAGCGFSPRGAAEDGGVDGSSGDGGDGDAASARPFCDRDDPDLRLCVTFTEGGVIDESSTGITFTTADLGFGPGRVDDAVQLKRSSVIHAAETPALDVTTALTMEAFVFPATVPSPRAGVIDNNNQWGMWIDANMRAYCTMSGSTVSGPTIAVGAWTHLACVFDGLTFRIYSDGVYFGTVNRQVPAPITGTDGTNLGQDCRPTGTGDPLEGGLDEVRIWAHARTDAELAAAAARRE